jgi:phospholipase C
MIPRDDTAFCFADDDGGDFYDHVVSPYEGVPADESPCNVPGHSTERFDFRRLGTRSTALAISPWIKKGSVIQEPAGPQNTSQWEHSSVSATIKVRPGLPPFHRMPSITGLVSIYANANDDIVYVNVLSDWFWLVD